MLNSIWKDYTLLGYFMHNLLQPLSTSTILIYLTSNISHQKIFIAITAQASASAMAL